MKQKNWYEQINEEAARRVKAILKETGQEHLLEIKENAPTKEK